MNCRLLNNLNTAPVRFGVFSYNGARMRRIAEGPGSIPGDGVCLTSQEQYLDDVYRVCLVCP